MSQPPREIIIGVVRGKSGWCEVAETEWAFGHYASARFPAGDDPTPGGDFRPGRIPKTGCVTATMLRFGERWPITSHCQGCD